MKIYLTDQTKKFQKHLEDLKKLAVMPYDKAKLTEKISTITINAPKNFDFLDDYRIFPASIMCCHNEWNQENRQMNIGDTIVQQVNIPPGPFLSQKLIFGVRITEIYNEEKKKGYTYQTLEGHVERGISSFTIEQEDGKTMFKIHTFSTPANLLTKLLGPVFSIPYQTFVTKKALMNVKHHLEKESLKP